MIVNPTDAGWECIYQRAHAWMSYLMLLELKPEYRTQDWPAVLHATLTHDHGWMEWKEAALDENGCPASFVESCVNKAVRLTGRAVRLARHQSLESAVLVARHVEELYGWREEAELVDWVGLVRSQRQDWMRRLHWSEERVEENYQLVLWADSASLILCVCDTDFVSQLHLKLGDQDFRLCAENENRFTLDPWPYQKDSIKVTVDTLNLSRKTFENTTALRLALEQAPTSRREWLITP